VADFRRGEQSDGRNACRRAGRTRFVPFAEGDAALVGRQFGEEGGGSHDEADVAMPPVPGARLAVVEAEVVLRPQDGYARDRGASLLDTVE